VTPRTAVSLLLGIVATCLAATAAVVVLDATRPAVTTPSVTQPSVAEPPQTFVIPDDPLGNSSSVTVITRQSDGITSSVIVGTSHVSVGETSAPLP
jgi:hypothetical protein